MISCVPQRGEDWLVNHQLRHTVKKIMNDIPGFQDRMSDELAELLDNIRRCAASLDNLKIDKEQRILMMEQLSYMASYAAVLATRLEDLEA